MVRIAEVEFSIFPIDAFLRAALVGVVEELSFDLMIMSWKSRGAIFRAPFPLIKELFSSAILRLLDCVDFNPVLAFVAVVRLCEVDCFALGLGEQSWVQYEYDDGFLIILKGATPCECVLSDRTEEWWDGGEDIFPIYRRKYEFRGM